MTTAVLLLQLGTPDAAETAAVKRYLAEFLADPRVVDLPRWQWLPILHGIILRTRPARSAALYRAIWRPDGLSPLLYHTRRQAELVQAALAAQGAALPISFAMRYGRPGLPAALAALREAGLTRLLVVPLFPQYASSTTGSAVATLLALLQRERVIPAVRVAPPFYQDPGYLAALAASLPPELLQDPDTHLLFSFHGLPQRHADLGDPYPHHCHATARALATRLGLPDQRWRVTFQSRFGREPWLQPYTDHTLETLPRQGITRLAALCPGFVADCLETLEEIAVQNRDRFLAAGGERFTFIPCLNDSPPWIDALTALVQRELQGWQ